MSVVRRRLAAVLRRAPRTDDGGLPDGMVAAGKLARQAARAQPAPSPAAADPEAVARRDRLIERLIVMQAELGGLYYEMAIRDHVRHEVLAGKAAELQRVDVELAHAERALRGVDAEPAGQCPSCHAPHRQADAFCSQCGHPLLAHRNGNGNGNGNGKAT
jgi:hypothetical protein